MRPLLPKITGHSYYACTWTFVLQLETATNATMSNTEPFGSGAFYPYLYCRLSTAATPTENCTMWTV